MIRFKLALLAREVDGGQPGRDLFGTVRAQAEQLWQLRLQRLTMLRQARQREETESARAHAEREVMRDALTGLGNRRQFDLLMQAIDAGTLDGPLTLLRDPQVLEPSGGVASGKAAADIPPSGTAGVPGNPRVYAVMDSEP